jgi:hypothetical protein
MKKKQLKIYIRIQLLSYNKTIEEIESKINPFFLQLSLQNTMQETHGNNLR